MGTDRNLIDNRVIANRYRLCEQVGHGTIGVEYRAEQIGLTAGGKSTRELAIRILPPDLQLVPDAAARFRREGELLCQLRSAHTVTTYEYGEEPDGTLWIALELVRGRLLTDVLRGEAPLEWPRVLRVLAGLCDSLGEAHGLGIVHRDLRPANIQLESRPGNSDFVKVRDFALAKLLPASQPPSAPGRMLEAAAHCSPEQLLLHPIDRRSDLYSLGVLGFWLVTGLHPFAHAHTVADLVEAHVSEVPPRASTVLPQVPPLVDALLVRCLEKDPADRYPDARTLADTITRQLAKAPSDAGSTMPDMKFGDLDTLDEDPPTSDGT